MISTPTLDRSQCQHLCGSGHTSLALDKIETGASLTIPLVLPLVQDGIPVTVSIHSIRNNVVECRAQVLDRS